MKSFAVVSLLATLAVAQVPSGISSGCSSYLNKLNSDTTLQSCTSAVSNATSAFGPGGSGSASDAASALNTLCADTTSCDATAIRSTLSDFYGACQQELTSNMNKDVLEIYDVLYVLKPLQTAICTKDDSGNFCSAKIAGTAPSASSLYTSSNQQVMTLNFDNLNSSNAAFLFLAPTLSSDKLCTTCTRNIFTSYVTFESDTPYAPGLTNSVLLGGQSSLYQGIQSTCGGSFLNNAVQAAGSLSDGLISGKTSGASRAVGASTGTIAALFGAAAVVAAAL